MFVVIAVDWVSIQTRLPGSLSSWFQGATVSAAASWLAMIAIRSPIIPSAGQCAGEKARPPPQGYCMNVRLPVQVFQLVQTAPE